MVIVRAPVRISFGGGGTDIPSYYMQHGGFVVSTAIARYASVMAYQRCDGQIHITSADYGQHETFRRGDIPPVAEPLSLPKAGIARFARHGLAATGIDMLLTSEVPPGTGLGSSSAMAVALTRALVDYVGGDLTTQEIAETACALEIDYLGMPIGKQDQYASAFGGLNTIEFSTAGVTVTPLPLTPGTLRALDDRLMLFSTGIQRSSGPLLSRQQANMRDQPAVLEALHRIKQFAFAMCERLSVADLDGFGRLLHECWLEKQRLSSEMSSPTIDGSYAAARAAGALGGKITGAGGGGYLLLYVPLESQSRVRRALHTRGLREMPFTFDRDGVQVMDWRDTKAPESNTICGPHMISQPMSEDTQYARTD
jgi:D-glycero-alpha-D-manno-heptose-7-phosphate kinase